MFIKKVTWCFTSSQPVQSYQSDAHKEPFTYPANSNKYIIKERLVVFECCFTSTETAGLLGTGAQDGHLNFHTAPEL